MIRRVISKLRHLHGLLFGPMPLDEFADYDDYWQKRPDTPEILHRYVSIAARIPAGASVADVGCGDGAFLQYLRDHKGLEDLHGFDLSETAIERLRSRGIHGTVIGQRISLRESVGRDFDHVVMMEVIEHVHDAEGFVKQAMELRPQCVFITIPNAGYFMHRLRLMFGGRFPITFIIHHMKEHIRFWTVRDFLQWADHLGFEVTAYEGQERTGNPLRLILLRCWPSMFAAQMIYHLKPKSR